ncbi:MAG: hypothetical protein KAW61_02755 [candidate division Zixibacteria bacterium]|nr:hypothetical protein [candidate division Zixibacteria bacterium]MCK4655798.1 hypothetical protein [candidate division Zixibacteria bacterium]
MIEVIILTAVLMYKFGPALSGLSYTRLDNALLNHEQRRGRLVWTIQISALLVVAACLYTRVDVGCAYLGGHYARLAADPFAFDADNPVSYRILTPLISYLLGLRQGCMINLTNLIMAGLLIGWVYATFRKVAARPGDAFLAAVTITCSLAVLTSIYCGGYTDVSTYLVIFLMWRYRDRRILFHVLFLLGLFNRESIAFLIPWFILISLQDARKKSLRILELALGFIATLSLYYLFRLWVSSQQDVIYSLDYYIRPFLEDPIGRIRHTAPYHGLGLFSVFTLLWVFPVMAAIAWWKERAHYELLGLILLVFCPYMQLFIADDTSRLFTLGFMIMIVALHKLLTTASTHFRKYAFWLILLNLFVPQLYTAGDTVEVFQSASTYLFNLVW